MNDFDFRQIASHCGGQREAFEELCCQLASRTLPQNTVYTRLRGAGGDGGVECFADLPDGQRVGWQAKYIFDIDALLNQVTVSLTTARRVHGTLRRYIVCFPFDLTGPTARRARSGQEKFSNWQTVNEQKALAEGRQLTIEAWSASQLRSLLLDIDISGGIRTFFFNHTVLSTNWFSARLDSAMVTAGPRYTPRLNVETNLWQWFAAFGRTSSWVRGLEQMVRSCREAHDRLASAVRRSKPDPMSPTWPEDLHEDALLWVARMRDLLDKYHGLTTTDDPHAYAHCITELDDLLEGLASLESQLAADLEARHGPGRADSPGFRQFMAEYMVSFPTANLDDVRAATEACQELRNWLQSPAGSLAFQRVFVLTGVAGSGKTHGVCDVAHQRFDEGLLTCVSFGHMFRGEPDPWTRLLESLGLPITLGMDSLLDALNAAAEASGSLLMICIDAINETRPLRYWRERLAAIVQALQQRPTLRLCITCRTSFASSCLPEGHGLSIVEHAGFSGVERDACKTFFQYYDLVPPITPMLQPELSNPLYLRLVCETLRARGLARLPSGWRGIAPMIKAFLEEKERHFAEEHETNIGANIIRGSLRAIARTIAESGDVCLHWSRAQQVIIQECPQARNLPVLEWLVRADLLIEDILDPAGLFSDESAVRPAFERLGDFLIAGELLARSALTNLDPTCQPDGTLYTLLRDQETVGQNSGIVGALSILIPEQTSGTELPNLLVNQSVRDAVLKVTVQSFPWRDPTSFSPIARSLLLEAIAMRNFSWEAMDAVLSIAWQPSAIDAIWLDNRLKRNPLAKRDAWWCSFLHSRYEAFGPVRRVIDAAFELPLDQVEADIAERWATILLWFTAAADRRVKDRATRAVVAIFVARPEVIPNILTRMLDSDDDEVRERALLCCYSALIISRNTSVLNTITHTLHTAFRSVPAAFDNALLRDHIRCIIELSRELGVLPEGCDPELTMQAIGSEWPLCLPSDEDVKRWEQLPRLAYSCLHDDFFVYSMGCLQSWEHAVSKQEMGTWILQQVAIGLGYENSGCEQYDRYILGNYGSGRGRKMEAERIGKKYQWLAMFQLASRLYDHVAQRRESYTPEPQRTPLILLEERKLDPTLPPDIIGSNRDADAWWIGASADLGAGENFSDSEWILRQEDLPALEDLLAVLERNSQRWRLLIAFPSWGRQDEDAGRNTPYRQVWVHLQSYIVPKEQIATAYDCIHRRNFFGLWMPEGPTWLYGFAGEYPWATPFNIEPEGWHSRGGYGDDLPVSYTPAWGHLAVEWEYDASLLQNFHMLVPARAFFASRNLWWDGRDGYRLVHGRTVFRDPSVTEGGPRALIGDTDDLLKRLDTLGLCLIWTLLGEKRIIGDRHDAATPCRTFSQIARLADDGSVEVGKLVIFEDYYKDTGPLSLKGNRKRRRKKGG